MKSSRPADLRPDLTDLLGDGWKTAHGHSCCEPDCRACTATSQMRAHQTRHRKRPTRMQQWRRRRQRARDRHAISRGIAIGLSPFLLIATVLGLFETHQRLTATTPPVIASPPNHTSPNPAPEPDLLGNAVGNQIGAVEPDHQTSSAVRRPLVLPIPTATPAPPPSDAATAEQRPLNSTPATPAPPPQSPSPVAPPQAPALPEPAAPPAPAPASPPATPAPPPSVRAETSIAATCTEPASFTVTATGGGTVYLTANGQPVSGAGAATISLDAYNINATATADGHVEVSWSATTQGTCQ